MSIGFGLGFFLEVNCDVVVEIWLGKIGLVIGICWIDFVDGVVSVFGNVGVECFVYL